MNDLVITPHPLTLSGQTVTRAAELRPGESLLQFLVRGGVDLDQPGWVVTIGGAEVPALMWGRTRPRHGQLIECRRMAGKKALSVIALLALAIFAPYVGAFLGPGIFGAGVFGLSAAAWTGIVTVGGSLLINKVLGPTMARGKAYKEQPQLFSVSGARNRARPFEPLGLLMGSVRYAPDFSAQPYVWFEGDDQFQYIRLHAGINAGSASDLQIGSTGISLYEGVTVSQAGFPGMTTPLQDWANVDTIAGGTLDAPGGPGTFVVRTSSANSVRLAVDLVAQLYSMKSDGGFNTATVSIELQRRLLPSGAWVGFLPGGVSSLTLTSKSTKPLRRTLVTEDLPAGQYEVRARKVTANVATTRASNVVDWGSLKSYQDDPTDYSTHPQIGIRIKANGQLQGALDEVNVSGVSAATPVWTGSAWVTQATSNPGALFLQFARGIFDGDGRLLAGMGLPDNQIDIEGLKAFMLHCAARGYRFDHFFTEQLSCLELMEAIAAAGLGSFSQHTGKVGVVWLADDQPVVGVVAMGNIRSGSLVVDHATRDTAQEIEVSSPDRDNGWLPGSVRVMAPGVVVPRETARYAPIGVTTVAGRLLAARLAMAQNIYQRKAVTWAMDLEHLTYARYGLIRFSHDVTRWGYSGRLAGVVSDAGVVTLLLDEPVPFNPTATARAVGLRIPGESGMRVFSIQPFAGEAHQLTLVGAWPAGVPMPGDGPSNPAHDTLWMYDFAAQPGQRLRITSIEPGENMDGATLTAVPEPDEFWTFVNTGAYQVPGGSVPAQQLVVSGLRVTQERIDLSYDETTELTLTFDAAGAYDHAQVWGAPAGQALQYIGMTRTTRFGGWRVPNDGVVDIEVRPFDGLGRLGVGIAAAHNVTLNELVGGSKMLRLRTSSQLFLVPKVGAPTPSSITLTAEGQNLTGSPSFTVVAGTATLTGSGQARTLTFAAMTSDVVTVRVSWDGLIDEVTVIKVREGSDAIAPLLTNESANVAADSAGTVASFAGAGGDMQLWTAAGEITSGVVYSVFSATGVTLAIDASTGVYEVSAMSADQGTATLRATYGSLVFDKIYNISKSRAGVPGLGSQTLALLASSYFFQVNKAGVASPASIALTAASNGLAGSPTFAVTLGTATLTGSGNSRTLSYGAMSSDVVTVQVTWDGLTDSVTIIKVREGSDAIAPVLTNESAVVAADAAGNVASFAGAGGDMQLWTFGGELTSGVVFSLASATGVTLAIDAGTGLYEVSAMSADQGTATLRATYGSLVFDKIYNISKSRTGAASVSSSLSRYAIVLPADSTGLVSSYAGAQSTVTIKLGAAVDTPFWSKVPSSTSGISTSLAGDTVSITAMATALDSGTVTLTCSKAGYADEVLVIDVSKAKGSVPASGPEANVGPVYAEVEQFTGTATATMTIQTDGRIYTGYYTNYYKPTTGGIGSTLWVRVDLVSGTAPSGPLGSVQPLSTARAFSLSQGPAQGIKSCGLSMTFFSDAGGTTVVGRGAAYLTAILSQ